MAAAAVARRAMALGNKTTYGVFAPFVYKNDGFTKTGSGQT